MTAPVIQTSDLTARWGDRVLFQDLNMCLGDEKVALIGRNGVGKSTLLRLLAGLQTPAQGEVVRRGDVHLVPQILPAGVGSPGEIRRELLARAQASGSRLLLLDEPTQDLDRQAVGWLKWWMSEWDRGALVATHDLRLLNDFRHFFLVAESGCRYLSGSFSEVEEVLDIEDRREQERYLRKLNRLAEEEERTLHIARRRRRKQQYGRCRELDRATSRARLNQKRDEAQVSHGRINLAREEKLRASREWARSARRALRVELPLDPLLPELPKEGEAPLLRLEGVTARGLFEELDLCLNREKLAVTGPNGAGKTTLLEIMVGLREPDEGTVWRSESIGWIGQGGGNWMLSRSLVSYLGDVEDVGSLLVSHRFPLALAERPLRSLSPGERVRAALIGLLSKRPVVELLVLDEPTYSLDLLGQRALERVLSSWGGGLAVASHDDDFLERVGMGRGIALDHTQVGRGYIQV